LYGHCFHTETGLLKRKRGIFSGTVITNLVDGCVNLLLLGSSRFINEEVDVFVGGDDNIIFSKGRIPSDVVSNFINRKFGVMLSFNEEDKYKIGNPVMQFLGSK
jgi:hypothetical protein